jgi:putative phage-type endonuclease
MSDFEAFRRTGIGGSDAAAVLGISPWKTAFDVYMEKTGEAEPLVPTEPMRWGTLLEGVIASEYARRTGHMVVVPSGPLRHAKHEWMIGHIDRTILDQPDRILEIKCAGTSRGWGEPGTDEIPQHYLCQGHHYLALTDAAVCDVAVLIAGNDFRLYHIERDRQIEAELIAYEGAFWRLVEDQTPPAPSNTQDAVRRWGRLSRPGDVVATETAALAVQTLQQLRETRKSLDEAEDQARLTVMETLGEEGSILVSLSGEVLATWQLDRGKKAYTASYKARPPERRFVLKG